MEALDAAVETVFALVGRHMVRCTVDGELRPADAVGAAANGAAQTGVQRPVALHIVIAQADIRHAALSVRHAEGADGRAVGQQLHGTPAVGKLDEGDIPAVQHAKGCQSAHTSALIAVGVAAVPRPRVGDDLLQPADRLPAQHLHRLLVPNILSYEHLQLAL